VLVSRRSLLRSQIRDCNGRTNATAMDRFFNERTLRGSADVTEMTFAHNGGKSSTRGGMQNAGVGKGDPFPTPAQSEQVVSW